VQLAVSDHDSDEAFCSPDHAPDLSCLSAGTGLELTAVEAGGFGAIWDRAAQEKFPVQPTARPRLRPPARIEVQLHGAPED
jgi:hypothetical protein